MPLSYEGQLLILATVTLLLVAHFTISDIQALRTKNKVRAANRFWNVSALIILSGFIFVVHWSKIDSDEFMPKCVRNDDPTFIENHLKAGGNPNLREPHSGLTLLTIAAWNGSHRVVRCLLDYGADPNLRDQHGETALDAAQEGWRLYQENQDEYEATIAMLRARTRNAALTGDALP